MKIIATSDWHIGNMFHGNDRLPEHKHFLTWLLEQVRQTTPDALLVAGDVFDNGNPSAAAQSAYYEFLAAASKECPDMMIIITAGNHDSAYRLEAPRPLLSRYKMEIRGSVSRSWDSGDERWVNDYDDLIIPIRNSKGEEVVVLAVPYLRNDIVMNGDYSQGVNQFIRELTARARDLHPDKKIVMMAHIYAKGAEIAANDASEKILIGGMEQVNMEGWSDHPDYMTCGHIHKRQHIWNTNWARYTGSILPMSFAEVDYKHGVDLITIEDKIQVDFMEYTPQHRLRILPENGELMEPKEIIKEIKRVLCPRPENGKLSSSFDYVVLNVLLKKVDNDIINKLEEAVKECDAVLCRIQKIMPALDLSSITNNEAITTIDDVLNRDPMDTLRETFVIKHKKAMSEHQEQLMKDLTERLYDSSFASSSPEGNCPKSRQ